MNVGNLIEELQTYDHNLPVLLRTDVFTTKSLTLRRLAVDKITDKNSDIKGTVLNIITY